MAGAGTLRRATWSTSDGPRIYVDRASVPRMPASVEKLYTTAAALRAFGPQGTLATDVLAPDG